MRIAERFALAAGTTLVMTLFGTACNSTPPEHPALDEVRWATYTNAEVGYTLEYPDFYRIDDRGKPKDVMFRFDGYPVLVINWVSEKEGRSRGLWPGHEPVRTVELAGLEGKKYIYRHYDGPFSMRTISFVVEHRGRLLGIEFRTNCPLDPIHLYIIESFRFTGVT